MKLRVEIEVTEAELKTLAGAACRLREDPRRGWSSREYKVEARWCVLQLVEKFLNDYQAKMGVNRDGMPVGLLAGKQQDEAMLERLRRSDEVTRKVQGG